MDAYGLCVRPSQRLPGSLFTLRMGFVPLRLMVVDFFSL